MLADNVDTLIINYRHISHNRYMINKTYFRRSSLLSARFVPQEIHACGAAIHCKNK